MNTEPINPEEIKKSLTFSSLAVPQKGFTRHYATFTVRAEITVDDSRGRTPTRDFIESQLAEIVRRRLYENNARVIAEAIRELETAHPASHEYFDALGKLRAASRYMEPGKRN